MICNLPEGDRVVAECVAARSRWSSGFSKQLVEYERRLWRVQRTRTRSVGKVGEDAEHSLIEHIAERIGHSSAMAPMKRKRLGEAEWSKANIKHGVRCGVGEELEGASWLWHKGRMIVAEARSEAGNHNEWSSKGTSDLETAFQNLQPQSTSEAKTTLRELRSLCTLEVWRFESCWYSRSRLVSRRAQQRSAHVD